MDGKKEVQQFPFFLFSRRFFSLDGMAKPWTMVDVLKCQFIFKTLHFNYSPWKKDIIKLFNFKFQYFFSNHFFQIIFFAGF